MNNFMTQFLQDTAEALRIHNKYSTQTNKKYRATAAANGTEETGGSGENNQYNLTGSNDRLGKDAFLQLLVTQLKYQDPLSPMDNKAFISQMAQFSSLEQMQNMNSNMENFLRVETLSQGAALVGKNVDTIDPDTGEVLSGKVERVAFEQGEVYAYLDNDMKLNVDNITAIH